MDFPRNGGMIAAKRGDGNEQKTTPESQSAERVNDNETAGVGD